MRLAFDVDEQKDRVRSRFAPPLLLFGFILISIALLFFFFPKEELLMNIAAQRQADKVAKEYIENLIALYPKDSKLKLLAAEKNIKLGHVANAVKDIMPFINHRIQTKEDWQALWLYFQILKLETYSMPEVSYQRRSGFLKMKHMLEMLSAGNLTSGQLMSLALDAGDLNEPKIVLGLYARVLKMQPEGEAVLYAQGGKYALGYSEYETSAQLYFIAEKLAYPLLEKRDYFISGLKSLQSGNLLDEAMKASEQHIDGLSNDRDTLLFLAKLALASNHVSLAQQQMKKILRMNIEVGVP